MSILSRQQEPEGTCIRYESPACLQQALLQAAQCPVLNPLRQRQPPPKLAQVIHKRLLRRKGQQRAEDNGWRPVYVDNQTVKLGHVTSKSWCHPTGLDTCWDNVGARWSGLREHSLNKKVLT